MRIFYIAIIRESWGGIYFYVFNLGPDGPDSSVVSSLFKIRWGFIFLWSIFVFFTFLALFSCFYFYFLFLKPADADIYI